MKLCCLEGTYGKRHHDVDYHTHQLFLPAYTKDESGELVSRTQWSLFLVGDGNFNGPRKSIKAVPLCDPPKRKPDATESFETDIDQVFRCYVVYGIQFSPEFS